MSKASDDVLAERRRQIEVEGWTLNHDDVEHEPGALAVAAGCYAMHTDSFPNPGQPPVMWPWDSNWWKPTNYRRDLVKAAALLLAEIERIDRACTHDVIDTEFLDGLADRHRCRNCGKEWTEFPK